MRYAATSIAGIELPLADRARRDVIGLTAVKVKNNALSSKMQIRCNVFGSRVRRSTMDSGFCREPNWMPSKPHQTKNVLARKNEPKFGRI